MRGYKLFYCRSNDTGRRLDRVVKKMLPDVPAGLIYSGIRKGRIRVNGKKSSQSYLINENDVINVSLSISSAEKQDADNDRPDNRELLAGITVFQTKDLCFINKPAGMLTQGQASLAELVKNSLPGIEDSLSFTPAPLHRLDRNTTGLIAVSRTITGASEFSRMMRERKLKKYYIGLIKGTPGNEMRLESGLSRKGTQTFADSDGRQARTFVEAVISRDNLTLCLIRIETGITHQIRSQLSSAGFPLAGDIKYGGGMKGFRHFMLHSYAMVPVDPDEDIGFDFVTAEIPEKSMRKLASIFTQSALDTAMKQVREKIID